MPTSNPRVNVTLSPSLYQLVGDLAQLQRVSRATVLRELLEASEPALQQAVAMMKAANELSAASRKRVAQDMEEVLSVVSAKAQRAMSEAAGMTTDLVAAAEAIRGRRPVRKGAASAARSGAVAGRPGSNRTPLPSKRGVKS